MRAWLEKPEGEPVPILGNLSLGRGAPNGVALPNERVSRRHAIIHSQGEDEYWLVDLGSRNGTYVNERRVNQPVPLRDGDQVRVGPFCFVFRQTGHRGNDPLAGQTTSHTLVDVRTAPCWLLVADVEGSPRLAQHLPADKLAVLMGQWFLNCKQIIEQAGGTMNKYLGDGYLAFWYASPDTPAAVVKVVEALRRLQQQANPRFRFVLHRGDVLLGGAISMGEESLSGTAVNFTFRLEKLARIEARGDVPVAVTEAGAVLAPVPVDYLSWSDTLDRHFVPGRTPAGPREIVLPGGISPLAESEIKQRGWTVRKWTGTW